MMVDSVVLGLSSRETRVSQIRVGTKQSGVLLVEESRVSSSSSLSQSVGQQQEATATKIHEYEKDLNSDDFFC